MPGLRSLRTRALAAIRRRSLHIVNIPPQSGIGLGNMLTYWLWAHQRRLQGQHAFVVGTEAMAAWIDRFPNLQELTIRRRDVPFSSQRVHEMDQWFPSARDELEGFIRTYLFQSPVWPPELEDASGHVTVNVRRGDYYSDERWRPLYAFDVPAYVKEAVRKANEQQQLDTIHVVSDDPDWCRRELPFLADYGDLHFQGDSDGPLENLLQLASARRLVLANSSFSYWAAYMSNTWHLDNHHLVWAPWFHRRDIRDGAAWQLDPHWSVVRDIPGGW